MTVEERAKTVTDEVGTATTGAELRALIEKALRDQIEDCAKVADEEVGAMNGVFMESTGNRGIRALAAREAASRIRHRIRALAGPTSREEGKED